MCSPGKTGMNGKCCEIGLERIVDETVRSLTPYAVIPVFVVLMDRVSIRVEEQMLEESFCQAWLEYAKKVRRWV